MNFLAATSLPPAEGATATSAPAVYVVAVMRPMGAFTFNKMLAYLLAHLGIISFGDVETRPNFNEVLEGVPPTAVTLYGYQYNLRGELVPVARQSHNDRYLPPRPFLVEIGTRTIGGDPVSALGGRRCHSASWQAPAGRLTGLFRTQSCRTWPCYPA